MLPALLLVAAAGIVTLDGDTFVLDGRHIRIANIDAPELGHAKCDAERRLAEIAKRRLAQLLAGGPVELHVGDPDTGRVRDRYGRTLATVEVAGQDVGGVLIDEDLARPWVGKRETWCE